MEQCGNQEDNPQKVREERLARYFHTTLGIDEQKARQLVNALELVTLASSGASTPMLTQRSSNQADYELAMQLASLNPLFPLSGAMRLQFAYSLSAARQKAQTSDVATTSLNHPLEPAVVLYSDAHVAPIPTTSQNFNLPPTTSFWDEASRADNINPKPVPRSPYFHRSRPNDPSSQ